MTQRLDTSSEKKVTGIRINRRSKKTVVFAYADDINIFVTAPEDIPGISDVIRNYESTTSADLNFRKSKAMR
jgi:hypothetical protein